MISAPPLLERSSDHPWVGFAVGLAGVAGLTGLLELLGSGDSVLPLAVCFQLLVLVVAATFGLLPGLVTGAASVVAFTWAFVAPVHSFEVSNGRSVISLAVMAATAFITAKLASFARREWREAEGRRQDAESIAALARAALVETGRKGSNHALMDAAAHALGVEGCEVVLDPTRMPTRATDAIGMSSMSGRRALTLSCSSGRIGTLELGPEKDGRQPRRIDMEGAVAGLVAMAVERSRLVERASEGEDLRRAGEMKTALLRGVAHELAGPVVAVRSAADALDEGNGDARPELAHALRGEAARVERLTADLLDLARLHSGELVAANEICDPITVVEKAVAAAEAMTGGRVEVHLPANAPHVFADPELCPRLLTCLLTNAARHGAPPVRIDARTRGERFEIIVTDEGEGVDPEMATRVFRLFVAGGDRGGIGVGLALARALADAQGGSLRMLPGPGGARFSLSLHAREIPASTR